MNTFWRPSLTHRRKRASRRPKIRWKTLGLQDPAQSSSAPSMEEIRRQITVAARQGLSSDTVSRSQQKAGHSKPGSKISVATRKRGAASP
jgi:hypothetical protein